MARYGDSLGYYYEEGFIEEGYIRYEPYIEEGYLPEDYFTEEVTILEAAANINAAFTTSTTALRILPFTATTSSATSITAAAQANKKFQAVFGALFTPIMNVKAILRPDVYLEVSITQTATANKTTDISKTLSVTSEIVVAFGNVQQGDAALSATLSQTTAASAVRQGSAQMSGAFTPSISVRATRQGDIDLTIAASVSITTSNTLRDEATLENIVNLSLQGARVRYADSAHALVSTLNGTASVTRTSSSTQNTTTSLSAIISHIEGADIVLTPFASLIADVVKNVETSVDVEMSFSGVFDIGILKQTTVEPIQSISKVFASRLLGSRRPNPVFGIDLQYPNEYFSSDSKFGTASAYASGNTSSNTFRAFYQPKVFATKNPRKQFTLEFWYKRLTSSDHAIVSGTSNLSGAITVNFYNGYLRLIARSSTTSVSGVATSYTVPFDTWIHLAVVSDGNYVNLYADGSRITVVDIRSFSDYQTSNSPIFFVRENINRIDEIRFQSDTVGGAYADTFPLPTERFTNTLNTDFLCHLDYSVADDTSILHSASASFIGRFTRSIKTSGTFGISANINAATTLSATIGKIEEINLTAFSNGILSADAVKNAVFDSALSSETTLSIDALASKEFDSALTSTLTQTATAVKTVDPTTDFDSIATQISIINKIGRVFIDCDSEFAATITAVKTTDIELALDNAFTQTAAGIKAVEANATLSVAATQTTSGDRIRFGVIDATGTTTATVTTNATFDQEATLSSNTTVEATTQGIIGISAELGVSATQTVNGSKTTGYASDLTTTATLVCSSIVTREFDVVLNSAVNLTAINSRSRNFSSTLDAFYAQISVVYKIADFFINADLIAAQTTTAIKTTDIVKELSVISALSIPGEKLHSTAVSIEASEVALSCEGFAGKTGEAYVNSEITQTATANYDASASANITATIAAECDVSIIRATASLQIAFGSLTLNNISVTREVPASLAVSARQDATARKTAAGTASIDSAMSATLTARTLRLDSIIYTIPAESGIYAIIGETYNYTIPGETRIHIV